jgi:hypothetical protein
MKPLWSLLWLALWASAQAWSDAAETLLPGVVLREAPVLQMRGASSPAPDRPGDTDCNSPLHWQGGRLYLFNSAGHPFRSSGPDLFHLNQDYRRCSYNNETNGGRWIECTWLTPEPVLYGWYHFEPGGVCANKPLTAPRIGAVRSTDNGVTWQDLGIILDAPPGTLRCDTTNHYFAGGNGDFSMILDQRRQFAYFFFSAYAGSIDQQGVAVARLRWSDRDQPVGKVLKWHEGDWKEPGLGGRVTPVFRVRHDWHQPDVDAFWGPSIHWNRYLRRYVMLLNRAIDRHWKQEGIYLSFNARLERPNDWAVPQKLLDGPGPELWYPQVVGLDGAKHDTDKQAGQTARLFVRGQSRWEIQFFRPEITTTTGSALPPRLKETPRGP